MGARDGRALAAVSAILPIVEVALGVGFLIFFHELGHFVVARLAGVRVDTFSLGFGPRILGWRRGSTDYRVSAIPLGGYVKLAGETPGSAGRGAPDELASKPTRWRLAIFLAGIVFNVLFAVVLFPILFHVGVPFVEPVVGDAVPGGPAWHAGIEEGTRIREIEGSPIYSFEQIRSIVALADPGPLRIAVTSPGGDERSVEVVPRKDDARGHFVLDIDPRRDGTLEVDAGGAAHEAGLRTGDRLRGGPEGEASRESLDRSMLRGEPLFLEVERDGTTVRARVVPRAAKAEGWQLGLSPLVARVLAVRPPLDGAGVRAGDRLVSIDGRPILEDFDRRAARAGTPGPVRFLFERDGGERVEVVQEAADAAARRRIVDALALEPDGTRVVPVPGLPAHAGGVRPGDLVVAVNGTTVTRWDEARAAIAAAESNPVTLTVDRGEEAPTRIEIEPVRRVAYDYGFGERVAQYTYRTDSLVAACALGWRSSVGLVQDFVLSIRRMFRREMSAKNLSGIVSIVGLSYRFSQVSFTKFLYFLGMLSLNLALINLLPIPLLDGGHVFFLLVERIKGSPVSERVLATAQVVGLVLIGGLVLFVTWNDIRTWFL